LIISGHNFGTNKTNIKVFLDNSTTKGVYELNVWQMNDTQITAILPGGKSNQYTVRVVKLDFGSSKTTSANVNLFTY